VAASRNRRRHRRQIDPDGPPGASRIQPGSPPDDQITFSFKYLHPNPPVSQNFPADYWGELMSCLKMISGLNTGEILGNRSSSRRAHGIDWDDSNIPEGFAHLPQHLRDSAGFQFSVKRDDYGRIVGLLLGNVFYVCWFDPEHQTTGRPKGQ